MKRAAALASAALLAGCGSSAGGSASPGTQRATVLKCAHDHGLAARPVGDSSIQVGEPPRGPRIDFLLSTGAAESLQFKGGAQGAEQIENALLYVRAASDKVAKQLENCIAKTV